MTVVSQSVPHRRPRDEHATASSWQAALIACGDGSVEAIVRTLARGENGAVKGSRGDEAFDDPLDVPRFGEGGE